MDTPLRKDPFLLQLVHGARPHVPGSSLSPSATPASSTREGVVYCGGRDAETVIRRRFYRWALPAAGEFVSKDKLGSGASSVVYKAVDVATGLRVAVKRIRKLDRFRKVIGQELLANHAITDHGHIVKLLQIVETSHYIYLVQELMGKELFAAVKERLDASDSGLTEGDARQATRSLCLGLRHMHVEKNLVHRDIKPENLLLPLDKGADYACLKIADLGFTTEPTAHLGFAGTASYVSPELARGDAYGFPNDMWGVGCVAFVMLAGYPPFYHDAGTRTSQQTGQLLRRIRRGKYVMRPQEWGGVSDEGKAFVAGLLEPDPDKRMTVEECLRHPWLAATTTALPAVPAAAAAAVAGAAGAASCSAARAGDQRARIVASRLKRHYLRQKFKRAVRVLLVTTRWRRLLLGRSTRVSGSASMVGVRRTNAGRGTKRKMPASAVAGRASSAARKVA
jgi:calcium/calmodulin-dependent protein kinase I